MCMCDRVQSDWRLRSPKIMILYSTCANVKSISVKVNKEASRINTPIERLAKYIRPRIQGTVGNKRQTINCTNRITCRNVGANEATQNVLHVTHNSGRATTETEVGSFRCTSLCGCQMQPRVLVSAQLSQGVLVSAQLLQVLSLDTSFHH